MVQWLKALKPPQAMSILLIVSDTLTFSTALEAVIPAETQLGRPIHAAHLFKG
jgi:hypothetical protein